MARDSYFLVFFRGATTLDDAEGALRRTTLAVHRTGDVIEVRWGEGPTLRVVLSTQSHVQVEAAELAEEKGVPALGHCDRRFEVGFDDLDEVLDETNTLAETQLALQDLTHGWITMAWNSELMGPEGP